MIRGFYSSAAGMLGQLDKQDFIANNLANVNTPGYKRRALGFSSFSTNLQTVLSNTAPCVIPFATVREDSRQGLIQDTGVPTNFALDGSGFFVIQTEAGEKFVRGGNFKLDSDGRIVNSDGFPVLGQKGPIAVSGTDWYVDSEGSVYSGGKAVDKLRIEVDSSVAASSKPPRVIPGSLESSNVNAVEEMVSMITALRAYEACQRAIQALDQTLDKVINQMGRIA